MDREAAKAKLEKAVVDCQGCKMVELVARPELFDVWEEIAEPLALIEEVIAEGRLVEVEYTVPNIPWRLKSFLLPKGSLVFWKQKQLED